MRVLDTAEAEVEGGRDSGSSANQGGQKMRVIEEYRGAVENSDEALLKEVFAPQVRVETPAGPGVNHSANTASLILSQVAQTAPGKEAP